MNTSLNLLRRTLTLKQTTSTLARSLQFKNNMLKMTQMRMFQAPNQKYQQRPQKTYGSGQQYPNKQEGGEQQGQDRLQYNGKKIYIRGLNIISNNTMMNVSIKPASYKETETSYTVDRNGYVIFDFTPLLPNAEKPGSN